MAKKRKLNNFKFNVKNTFFISLIVIGFALLILNMALEAIYWLTLADCFIFFLMKKEITRNLGDF